MIEGTLPSGLDQRAASRFFELSVDMLTIADFSGYFGRLSPSWERTLGWTLAELQSRPMIEFVHPDDRERTTTKNREVRSGGLALSFENRYRCKDGTYKWLLWNAVADREEQVIYSIAHDITQRKTLELERERLVEELRVALVEVRELERILPTCSYCRQVRDTDDIWRTVEAHIAHHTHSRFSHGVCPDCMISRVQPMFDGLDGA